VKRLIISLIILFCMGVTPAPVLPGTIDVFIKGVDDGVKTNKQQDYKEAVTNAKLQAIERAGVKIESITRIVNFQMKYKAVESKANAVLLPGFQIMDIGYQVDGTYQVVLSGKIQTDGTTTKRKDAFLTLISKGHRALESGHPEEAIDIAKKALEIPGFEENEDAQWLIKLALEEIERKKESQRLLKEKEKREAIILAFNEIYNEAKRFRKNGQLLQAFKKAFEAEEKSYDNKSKQKAINLQSYIVQDRLVDNGSVISDKATGLMWQKKPSRVKSHFKWVNKYCNNLTLGGYNDWRLPKVAEVEELDRLLRYKHTNDLFGYNNTTNWREYIFWTSTPGSRPGTVVQFQVRLKRGVKNKKKVSTGVILDPIPVRAVRDILTTDQPPNMKMSTIILTLRQQGYLPTEFYLSTDYGIDCEMDLFNRFDHPEIRGGPNISFRSGTKEHEEIELAPGKHTILIRAEFTIYLTVTRHPRYVSKVQQLDVTLEPGQRMQLFLNVYTKHDSVAVNISPNY